MQNIQPHVQFNEPILSPELFGDSIETLPSDQNPPTHNEIKMVETLFKENKSTIDIILADAKNIIFMGLLFIILSTPQVDDLIKKFVVAAESPYILILIKAILFMFIYFIINNLYLARKNN
jgi:hypothetical protein